MTTSPPVIPPTITAPFGDPGPRGPRRRKVIHGDPAQIAGPSWTEALYYFVLLAAAAVDVVTFHQVLLDAIDETETLLWMAAGGFTVVALALSHTAGQQAKQSANPRHVPGARPIALGSFLGWLLLGFIAFIFRYVYIEPASTNVSVFEVEGQAAPDLIDATESNQHLSALLFLAFYVGTGLVSGFAGFRRDPDARRYAKALARRARVAGQEARSRSVLGGANETWTAIEETRKRKRDEWSNTELQCAAAAVRLKQEARLRLLGRPSDRTETRLSAREEEEGS